MNSFLPNFLKNRLRPFYYSHFLGTRILEIESRHRPDPIGHVSLENFEYRIGPQIDAGEVRDNPYVSLYCFDDDKKQAIFAETPSDLDLHEFPFLYPAQFEYAQRLIAVPYSKLHRLTHEIDVQGRNLFLIYSVGRCGSTLVSQLFKEVDQTLSLSEPDAFTNLVKMREPDGSRDEELRHLLRSTIKILAQPLGEHRPARWAIKFRSFHTELIDLIYDVFPEARIIFLYRHAEARIQSMARAFRLLEKPAQPITPTQLHGLAYLVPAIRKYADRASQGRLTPLEFSALEWLSGIEKCLALIQRGVPVFAVRYEDMIAYPEAFTAALLDYCGISPKFTAEASTVFNKDSQQGTRLSKATLGKDTRNKLQEKHLASIREILEAHSLIKHADYRLPGTWQPV